MKKTETGPPNTATNAAMVDRQDLVHAVEPRAARPGVTRVLVADGARVTVFRFAAGQELPEHKAAFPILVQSLDGHLRFTAQGRDVELRPGALAHLTARLPHAVYAVTDATLQLTMLDPDAVGDAEPADPDSPRTGMT